MTTYPGPPHLLKGAIVALDPTKRPATVIVFQYNPDTVTRRLDARTTGSTDGGDRSEVLRLSGPPRETITLSIEIDATDQLEKADKVAVDNGVFTTLSALEMLLYPKSDKVDADVERAKNGVIEIIPPEAPLTLFVWGAQRALPVRLTSLSVTEEAYDISLNPIRAKVDLSLNVLSYADLKQDHPGSSLFMAQQRYRERLAAKNPFNNMQDTGNALQLL
jgi:hypothetical protein